MRLRDPEVVGTMEAPSFGFNRTSLSEAPPEIGAEFEIFRSDFRLPCPGIRNLA